MKLKRAKEAGRADYLSITELAELAGARYSTVKYYTEQGLLPFEQAGEGLQRRYRRQEAIKRLKQILHLKAQRLSIAEIVRRLNGRGPGAGAVRIRKA